MKIRKGFVSNSSSSSFIVMFPRVPTSVDDVAKMLFGGKSTVFVGSYPVKQVAETVFNDIQGQKMNDLEKAIELLSHSWDCPVKYEDYQTDLNDWKTMNHGAYDADCKKWAEKRFEEFFSLKKIRKDKLLKIEGKDIDVSGDVFFIFEYSDNDGEYFSTLEHGGLFDNLEQIILSHH